MVLSQLFRLIQQIWRKPSREHLFSHRLKRTYRLLSFFPLLGLIVVLIGLNHYSPHFSVPLKLHISSIFSPIIYGMDRLNIMIFNTVPQSIGNFKHALFEVSQLETLKKDLNRLHAQLQELQHTHAQLLKFLKLPEVPESDFMVTQAFGHICDGINHSLFINRHNLPLKVNMPVTTADGILGKITAVGGKVARVMMLIDPNFRLPVTLTRTNIHAIAAGDGLNGMKILHIERPESLQIGDTLITSGQGGIFPKGLYVGFIKQISPEIKIQIAISPEDVQFARVHEQSVTESLVPPITDATQNKKTP